MASTPVQRQIFFVNSAARGSGTNENFEISLPINRYADYKWVQVLQCSVPKSYYLIDTGRDSFTLIEDGVETTVTLAHGNYSRRGFANAVRAALDAASTAGNSFFVTVPSPLLSDNGKYTYSWTGPTSVAVSLRMDGIQTIAQALGFATVSTNLISKAPTTTESTNVAKIQAEDTLYLRSNICNNGGGGGETVDVLQEIFAGSTADLSAITYRSTDTNAARHFAGAGSTTFRFILTDEDGGVIDLHGLNMVFSLAIW